MTEQEQFAIEQGFQPETEEYSAFQKLSLDEVARLKQEAATQSTAGPAVISPSLAKDTLKQISIDLGKYQEAGTSPTGEKLYMDNATGLIQPASQLPQKSVEDKFLERDYEAGKTDVQKQYESDLAESNAILEPLKQRLEQNKQFQINNIQNQYSRLIKAQEEANVRRVKLQETIGIRFGGRYTPEHTADLVKDQVNQGLQEIAKLNSEENEAIGKIQSAFDEKQYTIAIKEYENLKDIRKQRTDRLNKIEETQLEGLKTMKEDKAKELQMMKDFQAIQDKNAESGGNYLASTGFKLTGDLEEDSKNVIDEAKKWNTTPQLLLGSIAKAGTAGIKDEKTTVNNLIQGYPDAGVLSTDSLAVASQKVANSPSFREKVTSRGLATALRELMVQEKTAVSPGQVVNAKTGLPVKLSDAEQEKISGYQNLLERVDLVNNLLSKVNETGAIKGWVLKEGIYFPVIQRELRPNEVELMQELARISNQYVYLVSGKQINEQEFVRLSRAIPDIRATKEANEIVLKNFRSYLQGGMDKYMRVSGWKFAEGETPETKTGGNFSTTYQGKTYTFPTQEALDKFKQKFQ